MTNCDSDLKSNQIISIYLDYAATTPIDKRVVEKMLPFLWSEAGYYANAASESHVLGKRVAAAIEEARNQVASLLNVDPKTLVFTSGATESINLALKGAATFYKRFGNHIITCQTEHRATLDTCAQLAREGFEISYLKTRPDGLIDLNQLITTLKPETRLVSIMLVNNETGVLQDIASLAAITRERGIIFHVDAAQAVGKIPIDLQQLPIDLMSFSAHKVYGPKGIGALYIGDNPKIRLQAQIHGGGQERGLRAGTLATHQILGMGAAFAIAKTEMLAESQRLQTYRAKLWSAISALPGVYLNGHNTHHVPGILNICFADIEKEVLLTSLADIAVSSASACAATSLEPSHVLRAMGLKSIMAHRSIRFSMGRFTTENDIDKTIAGIQKMLSIGSRSSNSSRSSDLSRSSNSVSSGLDLSDAPNALNSVGPSISSNSLSSLSSSNGFNKLNA